MTSSEHAAGGSQRARAPLVAGAAAGGPDAWVEQACRVLGAQGVHSLLEGLLEATIALTGAQRGFLVVHDPAEPSGFRVEVAHGMDLDAAAPPELSTTLVREALTSGRRIRLENALASSYAEQASIAKLKLLSVLVLPVRHEGEVSAAIYLDSRDLRAVFSEETEARVARLIDRLLGPIHEVAVRARLRAAGRRDLARLKRALGVEDLWGEDESLQRVLEAVACVGPTEVPVLLLGESGTGKERLARALHDASPRARGPFQPVHCGAIPDDLLEAELFGYEKGAFSGATRASEGRVGAANGGTLFLDEVGELSPSAQAKLLRLLEAREIQRLGRSRPVAVDCRIVAATHRDLRAMVDAGTFREDLYYRLHVVPIRLPALRERGDDARLLAERFLAREAARLERPGLTFAPDAIAAIAAYPFPGNIRELENAVRRAAILAPRDGAGDGAGAKAGAETIGAALLGEEVRAFARAPKRGAGARGELAVPATGEALQQAKDASARALERAFLTHVLAAAEGNVAAAARLARINRTFLHELIKRHDLDPVDFRRAGAGEVEGHDADTRAAAAQNSTP